MTVTKTAHMLKHQPTKHHHQNNVLLEHLKLLRKFKTLPCNVRLS
jgi:hypothetical protein